MEKTKITVVYQTTKGLATRQGYLKEISRIEKTTKVTYIEKGIGRREKILACENLAVLEGWCRKVTER